jgi:hypothetical protein
MNKQAKNRILKMETKPLYETTVTQGDFTRQIPDWDDLIEVRIQYYDGRESLAYASNSVELEVFNLYRERNRELWANDTSYD